MPDTHAACNQPVPPACKGKDGAAANAEEISVYGVLWHAADRKSPH